MAKISLRKPVKKTDRELFIAIEKMITQQDYVFLNHAKTRIKDRSILDTEVLDILEDKKGMHRKRNKRKDKYAFGLEEGRMMKLKTRKKYIYEGLGFPIQLCDVAMVNIQGDWHPKIDIRKIATEAIKKLALQEERLTGNQVKFIRSFFSMTLREFAETVVRESHTAVNKWEKYGNEVTNMDINIEKILRLYIYQKVCIKVSRHAFYDRLLEPSAISSGKKVSHLQMHV